jgi:hypothetical protein
MGQERWRWNDIPVIKPRLASGFCLRTRPGSLHLRQRGTRAALRVAELVMTGSKGYFQKWVTAISEEC